MERPQLAITFFSLWKTLWIYALHCAGLLYRVQYKPRLSKPKPSYAQC